MRLKMAFISLLFVPALLRVSRSSAAATKAGVIDAAYGEFSVAPPTPSIVFVCHGFGCKYRAEWDLTAERSCKAGTISGGRPLITRGRAQGRCGGRVPGPTSAWVPWLARKITLHAPGHKYMYDVRQFDCIDTSRNTTSLLARARSAQLAAASRRRRAGGAGFLSRWAAAACNGCSRSERPVAANGRSIPGRLVTARTLERHAPGALEEPRLGGRER